jgi:hypothetical protein
MLPLAPQHKREVLDLKDASIYPYNREVVVGARVEKV